jgi:hypothetical protein
MIHSFISILLILVAILPTHTTHNALQAAAITCADGYTWAESQTWWSQPNVDHELNASHIHLSGCWPMKKTISGIVPLDLTIKAHNLQGKMLHIAADSIPTYKIMPEACFTRFDCIDPMPDLYINAPDVTFNIRFNVDTRNLTRDGWYQLRIIAQARRTDILGENIQTTVSFMTYVQNGNVLQSYTNNTLYRASGHYWMKINNTTVKTGYEYAKVHALPRVIDNTLVFTYSLDDTSEEGNESISDYEILIDPDIHMGSRGIVLAEGTTSAHGPTHVTFDVSTLPAGQHKLMIRAGANVLERQGAKISGVLVTTFTK